jgi:molybdate transport system substrate-binding protein
MAREIKVLSTTAMKTTLDDLMPEFEKSTGNKVTIHFAPSAKIKQRVADGEETDVAIATAEGLEDLIKTNKIVNGSRADLAQSRVGLAVQKGAPKPDISSAEKFKQALLAAKSIGTSNPVGGGASGAHIAKVLEQLGITDAVKGKTTYGPGGPAGLIGNYLVRKEVEIGLQQIPELMAVPGIDIVGPLPDEIQAITVFSAGLSTGAKEEQAGSALIKFLTTPNAKAVLKSKGMEIK